MPLDLAQPPEKPLCPREGHSLTHRDVVGIEFFFCKTCHGSWFGAGALEELALHVAAGGSVPMSLASCRPPAISEGTARCLCPEHPWMTVRERDRVSVDECPLCGAVWLDGGEVEAILGPYSARSKIPERKDSGIGTAGRAVGDGLELVAGATELADIGSAILHVIGSLAHLG